MKSQQPAEAKANALSSRDELIFLFLQLQRTLIIRALSFYQFLDKKINPKNTLRVGPHILDIEDPQQISDYLKFLNSLKRRKLVELAAYVHQRFDRSRRFKDLTISILLYLRFVSRALKPRGLYGPYEEWVEKVDAPSKDDLRFWASSDQVSSLLSIFVLPQALKSPSDIVVSIQTLKDFNVEWTFYANSKDLEVLKEEMLRAEIDSKATQFQFVREDSFWKDIPAAVQNAKPWILVQNEPGRLASKSLHEIFELSKSLTQSDLAFTDSDYLEASGTRFHPKFHPKWNLRYFFGQNCFRGICLVSKNMLINTLKEEKTWGELLVNLIFSTDENRIAHIPKILFHSREIRDPYQDKIRETAAPLLKKNWNAKLQVTSKGIAHIVWPLPNELPKVSILIPTKDRIDLVSKLVDGILNHTDYQNLEIVIVDNRSSEKASLDYFEKIQTFSNVKVVKYDFPFNYSAINNFGFQYCSGEILALLNNDIEVIDRSWLKEMLREALAPGVGIVGAKLYYKNGFIQHAGVALGSGQNPGHVHGFEHKSADGYTNRLRFPHELSAVTAACMIMKSEIFRKAGGFNEKDLAVAYNDIDLCLRVGELGYKIVWTPFAELFHLESASRPMDRQIGQIVRYRQEMEFMRKRWTKLMMDDPFYNPNLAKGRFNFTVSLE